jgi:hypothetical protein
MDVGRIPNPIIPSEHLANALRELDENAPVDEPEKHHEYLEGVRETAGELEEFKRE